jgi:hypothetical protein
MTGGGGAVTPERWRAVKAAFEGALECALGERAAYLDRACAGDAALRAEVASLLAAHDDASGFLGTPAAVLGPAPPEALPGLLSAGQAVGPYTVLARLGAGGMGEVYVADDARHSRRVALKVVRTEFAAAAGAAGRARFLREVATLARLRHPHVLPLFDSGEADGGCSTTRCRSLRAARCATDCGASRSCGWTRRCGSCARRPRRSPTRTRTAWCTGT